MSALRRTKPSCTVAMQGLLAEIAQQLPLYAPQASLCQNICTGCPKKLMQYLEGQCEYWQAQIDSNTEPSLGDIHQLAKSAQKIHRVLQLNGILEK